MGGFEDALKRAVVEDRQAFQHLRRDLDDIESRRAHQRDENEAAVREFIAAKAQSREPGLQKWKVKVRVGLSGWQRRPPMSGWPVSIPDGRGGAIHYFVRDDGEVFVAVWVEGIDGEGRRTIVNPEPADLGARSLVRALTTV